jgi:hypothetical protein
MVHRSQTAQDRAGDAKVLRESGVHKLVIADHEGHCIAYLLVWDSFGYDAETDTYVCFADRDGGEVMTFYTEGDVKSEPGTNRYVVTAPTADAASEITGVTMGVAS